MTDKTIDIKLTETKLKGGWIIPVLSLIILAGTFFGGFFTYTKYHPCPVITSDTIYLYDTVIKTMTVNNYKIKRDTIIVADSIEIPADVDTAAILTAFYSTYQYTRTFEDTLLKAVLSDRVTQNKPAVISFDYTIKRPQTVIQNIDKSVTYNKYVYVAGTIPLPDTKLSDIGLYYAYKRGIWGVGYMPLVKGGGVRITGGFTLFKIK